jgi:glycerophosphoryl diester phosphodiesterase
MSLIVPKLVAHRGYAYRYPENTLLAIQAAVEAGARYVEFDVLMSADQVPVLFHDRDLQRMCGVAGAVHDLTLAQLKKLSVSEPERFADKFADNRITTLEEIVAYLSTQPEVIAFVELKRQGLDAHGIDLFLEKTLPLLEPLAKQVIVISYSIEVLLATQKSSDFPVAAVFDQWEQRNDPLIRQLAPQYMFTDIDNLPITGSLHVPGSILAVYDCVDPARAMAVAQRGVELVETFQVDEMLQALNKAGKNP